MNHKKCPENIKVKTPNYSGYYCFEHGELGTGDNAFNVVAHWLKNNCRRKDV